MSEVTTGNLMQHVRTLAGDIGERNVYQPDALCAAARYIESEFAALGYAVNRQSYLAQDVECANLEVSLPGQRWPDQIMVVGAHYDSVYGSPGRTTMPARSRC